MPPHPGNPRKQKPPQPHPARPATPSRKPHRLDLYEQAVQHPLAEVAFLQRVHRHFQKASPKNIRGEAPPPTRLREDFTGSAAVAAAWVMADPDHEAMAIDSHGPTVRFAQRRHRALEDLHIVQADVLDFDRPRVDLVAALNFSTFIWHTRADLLGYLRHARRCLRDGGVFVMDAFGGPDAQRLQTQRRAHDGFDYLWEQRRFNPATGRIDCRIHFEFPDGTRRNNAFRYDWRLWTPPELTEAMRDAGFKEVALWADNGHGRYRPTKKLPEQDAWVIYLTAAR